MTPTTAGHADGKPYLWLVPDAGPEWLSDEEVNTIVQVISPYWTPKDGQRHKLSQALSEWLASIGAPEGDIRIVMARLKALPQ